MLRSILLLPLFFIAFNSIAQNTVVVVPLIESVVVPPSPSFRIVSTDDDPPVVGRGRLEYTTASNPGGTSLWGKVCDDCFAGNNSCPSATTPSTHAAAQAVCRDLGFDSGLIDVNDTTAQTPVNFFSLDNVTCPDGALSFSQCTSSTVENCASGEEVFVECFNDANSPEIRFDGFTWSCATGLVGSFPALPNSQFIDIDDTNPLDPVLITAAFGVGAMRYGFEESGSELLVIFNGPSRNRSYNSSSSGQNSCPEPITVATESFEFEVTGLGTGLTWLVSGGWFVENNVFNFNELVFRLKTPQ